MDLHLSSLHCLDNNNFLGTSFNALRDLRLQWLGL
jgi:hypothetical protein